VTAKRTELEVGDSKEWRAWLERHHASSPGIWLVFRKTRTGRRSVAYEEAVLEALCFGWIDSLIRRLDEDRYARKFTPRRPTSKWSDINRRRWRDLEAAGLLRPAGLAAAPNSNRYAPLPTASALPAEAFKALKANRQAWAFFQDLAPTYRRHFTAWICAPKRPETREKRIRESVALLARRRRLGLK
jgi:uncharacterized protein YdeI (YjbR/CyaY-like superfamily)